MSTQPCPRCGGAGVIETGQCLKIVNGRQCRKRVVEAPQILEMYPEFQHLQAMCGFHRNAHIRDFALSLSDAERTQRLARADELAQSADGVD